MSVKGRALTGEEFNEVLEVIRKEVNDSLDFISHGVQGNRTLSHKIFNLGF